ncbi:MAG: hypothetical protein ACI8WT_004171 [Clostridium sp.]|jgi:hypothetical protein
MYRYNNNTAGSTIFNIKLANKLCTAFAIKKLTSRNKPVDKRNIVNNISVTFSKYRIKNLNFIFLSVWLLIKDINLDTSFNG